MILYSGDFSLSTTGAIADPEERSFLQREYRLFGQELVEMILSYEHLRYLASLMHWSDVMEYSTLPTTGAIANPEESEDNDKFSDEETGAIDLHLTRWEPCIR